MAVGTSAEGARVLQSVVLVAVALTLAAHLTTLLFSGANPVATPISQLSRGSLGWLHSLGLLSLAAAWLCLAYLLWHSESGPLWRLGCAFTAASAPIVCYVAWYFATASEEQLFGPSANDPLSALASTLGVAMGALQGGLRRLRPGIARLNGLILCLWLGLVLVIPVVDAQWLGAYERVVGCLMLAWTVAVSRTRI